MIAIMNMKGIPNISPLPIHWKLLSNPMVGYPPVIISANPLPIPIMPNVAIKGGMSPSVISKPDTNPIEVPIAMPTVIAAQTFKPSR